MDDLREQIRAQEGGLERLMRKIPGFAGYKDREQRRQADQIQRGFMADALTKERERMAEAADVLMNSGGLSYLDDVDKVRNVFDKVIERIRHATYGSAGFFDAIRINEAELDRVYEYDLGMHSDIAAIGEGVTRLIAAAESQDGFSAALKALETQVRDLDKKLDDRTKTMMGVS